MSHQTAQQRARARKAGPLRGKPAQLAPAHTVQPVRCRCSHLRLMHRDGRKCLTVGCECLAFTDVRDPSDQAAEQVRRSHVTQASGQGWSCSCGSGTEWPLAPVGRAQAAARAHLRPIVRNLADQIRREEQS